MEIALAVLVVLTIVTVVGHLIWIFIAAIFRLILGQQPPTQTPCTQESENPNRQRDLIAFNRILLHMEWQGKITTDERARITGLAEDRVDSPSLGPAPLSDNDVVDATIVDQRSPIKPLPKQPERPKQTEPHPLDPTPVPTLPAVPDTPAAVAPMTSQSARLPELATSPKRAFGEVLQSFLASNNIRWGELIAGSLIVVCSIGLVISLWNKLSETHRLIPSLIFMLGTAGVEAAGLYTLRKWNLKDTSRAVLIIATLLIPLNVVAGIGLATRGAGGVGLLDPVVLGVIVLATIAYTVMLWLSGAAILGKGSWQMVAAVGGPSLLMPFVPQAVREFGGYAAWLSIFPSVVAAVAVVSRLMQSSGKTITQSAGWRFIILSAVTLYTLGVVTGFMVFQLREFPAARILLAFGLIPTVLAFIACGIHLRAFLNAKASDSLKLIATSSVLIGATLFIGSFPMALAERIHIVMWAALCCGCSVALAIGLRSPKMLYFAASSAALGILLVGSQLLSGEPWDSTAAHWMRFLSGESTVMFPVITALLGAIAFALRRHPLWFTPVGVIAGGCAATGALVAAVVSVGPASWNGTIPPAIILGILLVNSLVLAIVGTWRVPLVTHIGMASLAAFSFAFFQPDTGWLPLDQATLGSLTKSMAMLLGWQLTLVGVWKALDRFGSLQADSKSLAWCWIWIQGTAAAAPLLACTVLMSAPKLVAFLVGACAIAWVLSSIRSGESDHAAVGQILGVGSLALLCHAWNQDLFTSITHWQSGTALWTLVGVSASFCVLWHGGRLLCAKLTDTNQVASRLPMGIASGIAMLCTAGCILLVSGSLAVSILGFLNVEFWGSNPWSAAWIRFHTIPLAAITLQAVAITLSLLDRNKVRLAVAMRRAAQHYVLLASTILTWFALTLAPSDWSALLIAATSITAFNATLGILLRLKAHQGSPVAGTIEQDLWPVNFWCLLIITSSILCAVAGNDIWWPVMQAQVGVVSILSGLSASILLLVVAMVIGLMGVWYLDRPLSGVANGLAIIGMITLGLTLAAGSAPAPLLLIQLFGISCLALVGLQRFCISIGIARWISNISIPGVKSSEPSRLTDWLWPSSWSSASALLATGGIITWAGLSIAATIANASDTWTSPVVQVGAFGNWIGIGLVIASGACWMLASGLRDRLSDVAVWLLLSAPVLADSIVFHRQMPASGLWSVMLVIWAVGTIAAAVLCVLPGQHRQRACVVAMCGSMLLMGSGLFSVVVGAVASRIWLSAWAIGTVVGACVTMVGARSRWMRIAGGIPIVSGVVFCFSFFDYQRQTWSQIFGSVDGITKIEMTVAWLLLSGVVWRSRYVWIHRTNDQQRPMAFRIDSVVLWCGTVLMALMSMEVFTSVMDRGPSSVGRLGMPLWLMLLAAVGALISTLPRWDHRGQTSCGYLLWICLLTNAFALIGSHFTSDWQRAGPMLAITIAFASAVLAWLWPMITPLSGGLARLGIPWGDHGIPRIQYELSGWFVISAGCFILGAIAGIIVEVDVTERWLWIGSVVCAGIAIGRIGNRDESNRLRTIAVVTLCTAALTGAVADVQGASLGEVKPLAQCMRLFIAAVWLVPIVAWVAPKVIFLELSRWQVPLRRATTLVAGVAGTALVTIFVLELGLRANDIGIPTIPNVLVYGTSIVIAVFSLLALLTAIYPSRVMVSHAEQLSVGHRQLLIYLSQVLILLAVANKFLCQPSTLGIREYWPYIVMSLAFLSAGLSTWAKRRGDDVLLTPLRNSAIYLPLIPIIGFWLTSEQGWIFAGGDIRYNLLLVIAAVFYLAMSALWPGDRWSRIAGIVAANAALWVTLTEHPEWGFVNHPQLWLIPPAVCVLIAIHLERNRLNAQIVTACRYGSTLVIYVSSTADMIVQEIGTSISGPIVLIILAFFGVLAGMLLRIRAFLYLGTTFIGVGLVSMVWHAGKAINQVWPWWVFGITSGLILLGGLMAIEKHKDSLRRFALRLNQWD